MFLRAPFEENDKNKILSFIEKQSFATLVSSNGSAAPIASHLPVDALPDESSDYKVKLISHLANGNPHLQLLSNGSEVLIIFLSDSSYISPSWFENKSSAPTQSHMVVHVYGKARVITDPNSLLKIMEHQVKVREKSVGETWRISSLGENGINSRLKQISGIEIGIDRVEASFRLLQDESKENVEGVLSNAELGNDLAREICNTNGIDANKALQRTSR